MASVGLLSSSRPEPGYIVAHNARIGNRPSALMPMQRSGSGMYPFQSPQSSGAIRAYREMALRRAQGGFPHCTVGGRSGNLLQTYWVKILTLQWLSGGAGAGLTHLACRCIIRWPQHGAVLDP